MFNPYHATDETERNDFYMHRDAIDLAGRPPLQLVIVQAGISTPPDICPHYRASDESPCSGSGLGGTGGFPPFPRFDDMIENEVMKRRYRLVVWAYPA